MTLRDEIHEQPETVQRVIDDNRESVATIVRRIREVSPTSVLMATRGTSDNAARYAQYV